MLDAPQGVRAGGYDPRVSIDGDTDPAQAEAESWVPEVPEEPEARSRYDLMAEGYARWWGPVIRPGAVKVLDALAPEVAAVLDDGREPRLLDVGSGTGALAVAALERWPTLRVTGIDPSGGMLEVARRAADESLPAGRAERFETVVAYADELPFEPGSFDVVLYRLVLHHVAYQQPLGPVFAEAARLLRPGGHLVSVEPGLWHPVGAALALANRLGVAERIHGTVDDVPLSPRALRAGAAGAGLEPEIHTVTYVWRRLPRVVQRAVGALDPLGSAPLLRNFGHHLLLLAQRPH